MPPVPSDGGLIPRKRDGYVKGVSSLGSPPGCPSAWWKLDQVVSTAVLVPFRTRVLPGTRACDTGRACRCDGGSRYMGGAAAHGMVPHLLEEAWKWSLEVSKCYHCFMGLCIGLLFLLMTPVTHGVLGRKLHGASEWQLRKTTFRGGKRFVLLQAISWAAWSTSLIALMAAAVVVLNAYAHAELPSPVLSGAAVCGAVLSEVVQVCSLLFFQVSAAGLI